jgi:hypothetical protein
MAVLYCICIGVRKVFIFPKLFVQLVMPKKRMIFEFVCREIFAINLSNKTLSPNITDSKPTTEHYLKRTVSWSSGLCEN